MTDSLGDHYEPDRATCLPRAVWLGAAVLLVLAVGSRTIGLGWHDPWGDEVYSYQSSIDLISKLLTWDTPGNNSVSPMPFIEIKIARKLFGSSDWALRVLAAAYGVVSVVGLYLLVGWRINWSAGFASGLLLAANPLALEWSREARMYTNWLVYAMASIGLALWCTDRSRRDDASALDWRWWLLGVLWVPLQASHALAVTTIAAVGLWLGIMGLTLWPKQRRAGNTIILGAMVSSAVYLSSWALTGLAKLLEQANVPKGAAENADPVAQLIAAVREVMTQISGYLPPVWAGLLWVAALAGLLLAATRGRWRAVLLITLVAATPWLVYPSVASRHFFTARYVFVALIAFSTGLGSLIAWLWHGHNGRWPIARRIGVVIVGIGLACLWLPAWRSVYLEPKMQVRRALAPVLEHAREGEVFIMVPDWYADLGEYYDLGDKTLLIRPPVEARYAVLEADRIPGGSIEPFSATFEDLYDGSGVAAGPEPAAAWLFMQLPEQRLDQLGKLLTAYGLDTPEHRATLEKASVGAYTLTLRLSPGKIDHIVKTPGRRHR